MRRILLGRTVDLLLSLVPLVVASPISGQGATAESLQVRITDDRGRRYSGALMSGLGADPVEILQKGDTVRFGRQSIDLIEVTKARGRGAGFVRGGILGGLGGAAAGGRVTGLANRNNGTGVEAVSAGESVVVGAVLFGALGLVAGGLVGLARPGSDWVPVSVSVAEYGGPRLRMRLVLPISFGVGH